MNNTNIKLWGIKVSFLSLGETVDQIITWAKRGVGGVILCCGLNDVVYVKENVEVAQCFKTAALITPDGMPLVWLLKLKEKKAERVYGPDLMNEVLKATKFNEIGHYFLGTTDINLIKLKNSVELKYWGVNIVGTYSPPFKEKFNQMDISAMADKIKSSNASIVWLGVGSPKQIILATELNKVLPDRIYITVGAAFDFLAGTKRQAPKIIRQLGFEWLFRLISEPKRLFPRYKKIISFLIKEGLNFDKENG